MIVWILSNAFEICVTMEDVTVLLQINLDRLTRLFLLFDYDIEYNQDTNEFDLTQ